LLFGDLFSQELDALSLLLIAHRAYSILADLQVELVDFSLCCSLSRPLVLQLRLKLV